MVVRIASQVTSTATLFSSILKEGKQLVARTPHSRKVIKVQLKCAQHFVFEEVES